jgi:hypothetical protein
MAPELTLLNAEQTRNGFLAGPPIQTEDALCVLGGNLDATSSCHFYPRGKYIETALLELGSATLLGNKKLIVSTDGSIAQTYCCLERSRARGNDR